MSQAHVLEVALRTKMITKAIKPKGSVYKFLLFPSFPFLCLNHKSLKNSFLAKLQQTSHSGKQFASIYLIKGDLRP